MGEPNNENTMNLSDENLANEVDSLMGMVVHGEEEAHSLYNSYAIRIGFSIRRSRKRPGADGILRQREFCCSKEGEKYDKDNSTKQRQTLETRTGCKAMVRFSIEDGKWTITKFISAHNHELALPSEAHMLRSNRKLTSSQKNVIDSMMDAGLRSIDTFSYLSKEAGGDEHLGFLKRDFYKILNLESCDVEEHETMRHVYDIVTRSEENEICRKICKDTVRKLNVEIERELSKLILESCDVEEHGADLVKEKQKVTDIEPVLDPLRAKTKGTSNARFKSHFETRRAKGKKNLSEKGSSKLQRKKTNSKTNISNSSMEMELHTPLQLINMPQMAGSGIYFSQPSQLMPTTMHNQMSPSVLSLPLTAPHQMANQGITIPNVSFTHMMQNINSLEFSQDPYSFVMNIPDKI